MHGPIAGIESRRVVSFASAPEFEDMRATLSAIIFVTLIRAELPPMFGVSDKLSNAFETEGRVDQSSAGQPSLAPANSAESSKVAVGSWGGEHISLQVTEKGAVFELDCASGVIEDPLALDSMARFDCKGMYVREHGGPAHEGQRPDVHPARFSGSIDGKKMTLIIKLTDTGQTIGEFTLMLGREPQLTKCL
jgi:hypothetical protein